MQYSNAQYIHAFKNHIPSIESDPNYFELAAYVNEYIRVAFMCANMGYTFELYRQALSTMLINELSDPVGSNAELIDGIKKTLYESNPFTRWLYPIYMEINDDYALRRTVTQMFGNNFKCIYDKNTKVMGITNG